LLALGPKTLGWQRPALENRSESVLVIVAKSGVFSTPVAVKVGNHFAFFSY